VGPGLLLSRRSSIRRDSCARAHPPLMRRGQGPRDSRSFTPGVPTARQSASGAPARPQPHRALRRARRQSHRRSASEPHHGPRRRTVMSALSPESWGGRPAWLPCKSSVSSHSPWHQSLAASGTEAGTSLPCTWRSGGDAGGHGASVARAGLCSSLRSSTRSCRIRGTGMGLRPLATSIG
jgi:hypothetical protein